MGTTMCGAWSKERVLAVLGCKVAMAGKAQPVAAMVLARLEAK